MLRRLGIAHAQLSVHLTDDHAIRELNHRYRSHDRPTDVLAFPLDIGAPSAALGCLPPMLGDVVISVDTAQRQARAHRRELEREVCWLLAHGLLHLVGHDHATPTQRRRMEAATRTLVRAAMEPADSDPAPGRSGGPPLLLLPALRRPPQ